MLVDSWCKIKLTLILVASLDVSSRGTICTEIWMMHQRQRRCTFLKQSHAKNSLFHWHTTAKHDSGQTCLMFSAVFLKIFCSSVHAYMCQFKCVYEHKLYSTKHVILWAGECVNVYAEAQRYSFGHMNELCMEQTEFLKIYFFLSANYSV